MEKHGETESKGWRILSKIAAEVAKATIAAISEGNLHKETKIYVARKATLVAAGGLTLSSEREEREIWDAYELNNVVEEARGRLSSELEVCAEWLSGSGSRDLPTVRGDLALFLRAVAEKSADRFSVEVIAEMVDSFVREMLGGSVDWFGEVWLDGIRIVGGSVEIGNGLTLRPPVASDFDQEWPAEFGDMGFGFAGSLVPDSVLAVAHTSRDRPDLRREINALSLFRFGRVKLISESWRSSSILAYKSVRQLSLGAPLHNLYSYEISEADGSSLSAFIGAVAGQLPIKPTGHHGNRRWLGLKNYFRALHTASDVEERLGQSVASLEASLLSGEKNELRYRLSMRTASILRFAGLSPVEVFADMKAAYDFRSAYAHGGEIESKGLHKAAEICPRVMDYARLVVIKLIEFPEEAKRKRLIALLDDSLLDDSIKQELAAELNGGLWKYSVA